MLTAAAIAFGWTLVVVGFVWKFRGVLLAIWREPTLQCPVLIVESDDWGPGPEQQCGQLDALRRILCEFTDQHDRHPVVTLGIVLAIPDRHRMRADHEKRYHRLTLGDPRYSSIVSTMLRGAQEGVFALQLHGMEHFWPDALMKLAGHDELVEKWLTADHDSTTEELPSALQSRWVDASRLPSMAIPDARVQQAVDEEVRTFNEIFSTPPVVVVPPTFVWDSRVEVAWAAAGVRVVVTPGRRYESRAADGGLRSTSGVIRNGEKGEAEILYVVRDDYFEPMFGHHAERGLAAFQKKSRLGRPTLLEMHRANFIGDVELATLARGELRRLLSLVLERAPHVRFMTTAELTSAISTDNPDLVEHRLGRRVNIWLGRLNVIDGLRKTAWLTGVAIPALLLYVVTSGTGVSRSGSG